MQSFPAGVAVTVTIPHQDQNGDPLTPAGLRYFVYGDDDLLIDGPISPAVTGSSTSVIVVGADNTLADGQIAGYRRVVLEMTTTNGVFTNDAEFIIRAENRLVLLGNSFQSYSQAMVLADEMPGILGWEDASRLDRTSALIEAYDRLTRFAYRIIDDKNTTLSQSRIFWDAREETLVKPGYWSVMTLQDWTSFPARFINAIRKAQIAEADSMLGGDPLGDKRRMGIASERIGESEMTFRAGIPPKAGASSAALEYVARYIDRRVTLSRV